MESADNASAKPVRLTRLKASTSELQLPPASYPTASQLYEVENNGECMSGQRLHEFLR